MKNYNRIQNRQNLYYLAIAILFLVMACKAGPLEVRGNQSRIVGDTITIEYLAGENEFTPKDTAVLLRDAAGHEFVSEPQENQQTLEVVSAEKRKFVLVVPPGVAEGLATITIESSGVPYDVEVTISRVAIALSDSGKKLTFAPLTNAELQPRTLTLNKPARAASLAFDARTLAVITDDALSFFDVGKSFQSQLTNLRAPVQVDAPKVVAAVHSGALVASATKIELFTFEDGTKSTQFDVENTKAIAVAEGGTRAVALTSCDTDGDDSVDADCVVMITLDSPAASDPVVLPTDGTASHIAIDTTGLQAVVLDNSDILGIDYNETPPKISSLNWTSPANPAGVDRTETVIRQNSDAATATRDLFAAAESTQNTVVWFGFSDTGLRYVSAEPLQLEQKPFSLQFGPGLDLYTFFEDGSVAPVDVLAAQVSPTDAAFALPKNATSISVQR